MEIDVLAHCAVLEGLRGCGDDDVVVSGIRDHVIEDRMMILVCPNWSCIVVIWSTTTRASLSVIVTAV